MSSRAANIVIAALALATIAAALAQTTARTTTWTREGGSLWAEDTETGLRLVIDRDGIRFDFNGHKFPTEAETQAYLESYAADAIRRHRLSAITRAR